MNPWAAFGFCIFFIACGVVGTRLLLLARRTRKAPELMIGIAILCYGPLGFIPMVAARLLPATNTLAVRLLTVWGLCGLSAAAAGLFLFIWRVFRPIDAWARALCYLGFVLLSVATAADAVTRVLGSLEGLGLWFWIAFLMRIAPLVWSSLEALRYFRMMRRRLALGLADPVVTLGFLLWGIASAGAAVALGGALAFRMVTGVSITSVPSASLAISLPPLISAVCLWLAFFPPPALGRWLRPRVDAPRL